MSNFKPNEQDQRRAENIRRQYISQEENKMNQLQKLDNKVKMPGKIAGCFFGTLGALVMGMGMSFVMVWDNMTSGLIISIPGLIAALLAYPLYSLITNSRKKKYADEIIRLSNELISR